LEPKALPRVTEHLGLGDALCEMPRPRWWHGATLHAEAVALHGLKPLRALLPVLVLPLEPGSADLLFLDQSLGGWDCPNLCRGDDDLVSLAAWRWGRTRASAAWHLARILGLGRPMP
jgi:hypothetical protein